MASSLATGDSQSRSLILGVPFNFQDTFVAIHALTMFALLETNKEFFNMHLDVGTTSSDWTVQFRLDKGVIQKFQNTTVSVSRTHAYTNLYFTYARTA